VDIFTASLWGITGAAFAASLVKNKQKTFNSMKMARGMMRNMIGEIIGILFLIGLILTFIPPEVIKNVLGESIPAFVAFPLVGSFVDAGASIVPAVAFLTTLTMVGVVTFPLEKQEFGLKFATARNVLSFVFALIIALTMGVIM
jgi:uncharacterized membrane protein YraQ (UPF0718 family)